MPKEPVSIVTNLKVHECFICGWKGDLALHHMIHGQKRQQADKDHLTCWLCVPCHTALHDHGFKDRDLQKVAQMKWMKYHKKSVSDWIQRYGKSYL